MERSIAAHNPADVVAWLQARTPERNLQLIEKAIVRGGVAADAGTISHSKLYNTMHPEAARASSAMPAIRMTWRTRPRRS